ncbi:pollen receptor-like kinase 1 [Salvia miltiorrhiza]|uniref:pollen receptor-like kinase 1 n=1 Tax=Salvia miltiorrhiza TaxID=226208 RepID=UPI0025AD6A53|nr:pollen receptor-like kinase 1 [Salvia miltiorrhiza]
MMVQRHVLSEPTRSSSPIFLLLLLFHNLAVSHSQSDAQLLLKFKASLRNTAALADWTPSQPPCSGWKGVLCASGHVWGLQLENMGLHGLIDVETLAKLSDLRSLSFKNNDFQGSLPNLTRHGALKTVFLSNNKFSGEIPDTAFYGMQSLKKLHLANNKFTGAIPATLATLPRLIELTLQDNEFEGQIPNFRQQGLKNFNVSNNRLAGQIPQSLSHLDASSFYGNEALCGAPLDQACPSNADDKGGSHHRRFPETTIAVVAILLGAALIALLGVCIFFVCRKKRSQQGGASASAAATPAATADLNEMERGAGAAAAGGSESGKPSVRLLTFLKEDSEKFDMQELLKASAEVLGSSVFGSTYKAGLNGKKMTVKRFKHMNQVSKEDFNEHMRRLGRMSHQNVQPIVAFYYKKEEKLLVAEFAHNVSLAARLHANDHPSLDWATRLKIVKGVAKGLLYLHNELPSLTPAHGHLKASNVLLDAAFSPLLTDYGLIPIVNKEQAQENMVAYKSPEYKETGKLTKKTDVWSFGYLILEILTGKSGVEQQAEVDLAAWVETAVADDTPVFDPEMGGSNHGQGEMMKLLKIGLSCCQADADSRPEIREVVEKVEEIKEKEFDEDFYSSYASESDMRSSRGLSDDFKSINI